MLNGEEQIADAFLHLSFVLAAGTERVLEALS